MAGEYPEKYDLDGIYFRVERDGKWGNACLSDLTEEEFQHVMEGRPTEWYINCIDLLRGVIRELGEQFGLRGA